MHLFTFQLFIIVTVLIYIAFLFSLIGVGEWVSMLSCMVVDLVSDMLGSEKYKHSWHFVLDSFQDSTINRSD